MRDIPWRLITTIALQTVQQRLVAAAAIGKSWRVRVKLISLAVPKGLGVDYSPMFPEVDAFLREPLQTLLLVPLSTNSPAFKMCSPGPINTQLCVVNEVRLEPINTSLLHTVHISACSQ